MSPLQPPANYRARPVAVLGAGVLGRRIAACWLAGGWDVIIRNPGLENRKKAEDYIAGNLGSFLVLTHHDPGKLSTTDDLQLAVKDAWLVIEAVPEKLNMKIDVFADLEKLAPADAILATNSSSFKSGDMLDKVSDVTKKRILNTHYTMPPASMLVELMPDGFTEPQLVSFLIQRSKEAGLHPIEALKPSSGFVLNRIWAAIKRETLKVLQEGVATPTTIDAGFREMYSAKQGPCQMMDNVGLDTVALIEQHYVAERGLEHAALDWLNNNFVSSGKLGTKTPSKGGLYPMPEPGSQTKILFLNLGVAEPLDDKLSYEQILHRGQVLSYNVDEAPQAATQLVSGDYMPDGIDVAGDRMYWTHMGNPKADDGTIVSAKLDGSDVVTVVHQGKTHTPKQLITDPEDGKMYWCDREGGRVMRCKLDGSDIQILVQTGDWHAKTLEETQWCVGIAISRRLNKVFWTQKGPSKAFKGRIFSAPLETPKDPTNRSDIELVIDNLPECIDLDFDDEEGALYWTDRGDPPLGNTLNKKTLVGGQPKTETKLGRQILAQGFSEAIGLKVDSVKDCVWVADLGGHIWKCNRHRPAFKDKVYEHQTGAFSGVAVTRV